MPMCALSFDGREARVADVPEPEPGPDDAIVCVSLAGVCRTDLEIVHGYLGFRGVLGHEFVGSVEHGPTRGAAGASGALKVLIEP